MLPFSWKSKTLKENQGKWSRGIEFLTVTFISFTICVMILNLLLNDVDVNEVNYNYNERNLKIVCYYQFPSSKTDLLPENIPNLCTHINLAFATVNCSDYSLNLSGENLKTLAEVNTLKIQNKNLKILISVGGAGNTSFSCMVINHLNRKRFIKSAMTIIKAYELDGIDLDWEWPVFDGGTKEKVKFIQLLYEIRQEFNRHEKKYFLTAAVAAVESIIDTAYYIEHMAEQIDFVNVMSYDYHFFQTYYPLTDYNAPLFSSPHDENSLFATLNVNFTVDYWLSQSMPKEKLVIGIPAYGHTYKLSSLLNQGWHAPATGIGSVGSDGFASYSQICDFLKKPSTVRVFDNDTKVPYAYNFLDWISYDDETSIQIKAEFIVEKELAGAMVWSLNNDDYEGVCGKGLNFPLTRTIHSVFYGNSNIN